MKAPTFAIALSILCLAFAGCQAVNDVQRRFSPDYHAAVVAGDKKAAFEAARQAAVALGFRLTGGGPMEGRFDAVNAVRPDSTLRGATQLVMKVRLVETGSGTRVDMLLLEDEQSDSAGASGLVTETPLQDSALYAAFFDALAKAPAAPAP